MLINDCTHACVMISVVLIPGNHCLLWLGQVLLTRLAVLVSWVTIVCVLFTKLMLLLLTVLRILHDVVFGEKRSNSICEEIRRFLSFLWWYGTDIFEFEWRKCTSSWIQELHQAVTLESLPWTWPITNSVWLFCPFLPVEKKNPPMWCRLVYCLLYSSLLILQMRCFFFFQWKVLTGEIFKVVLKANKPFLKNERAFMCCRFHILLQWIKKMSYYRWLLCF